MKGSKRNATRARLQVFTYTTPDQEQIPIKGFYLSATEPPVPELWLLSDVATVIGIRNPSNIRSISKQDIFWDGRNRTVVETGSLISYLGSACKKPVASQLHSAIIRSLQGTPSTSKKSSSTKTTPTKTAPTESATKKRKRESGSKKDSASDAASYWDTDDFSFLEDDGKPPKKRRGAREPKQEQTKVKKGKAKEKEEKEEKEEEKKEKKKEKGKDKKKDKKRSRSSREKKEKKKHKEAKRKKAKDQKQSKRRKIEAEAEAEEMPELSQFLRSEIRRFDPAAQTKQINDLNNVMTPRVIAVLGPGSSTGHGQAIHAYRLGTTLARLGARVLLVDCDWRCCLTRHALDKASKDRYKGDYDRFLYTQSTAKTPCTLYDAIKCTWDSMAATPVAAQVVNLSALYDESENTTTGDDDKDEDKRKGGEEEKEKGVLFLLPSSPELVEMDVRITLAENALHVLPHIGTSGQSNSGLLGAPYYAIKETAQSQEVKAGIVLLCMPAFNGHTTSAFSRTLLMASHHFVITLPSATTVASNEEPDYFLCKALKMMANNWQAMHDHTKKQLLPSTQDTPCPMPSKHFPPRFLGALTERSTYQGDDTNGESCEQYWRRKAHKAISGLAKSLRSVDRVIAPAEGCELWYLKTSKRGTSPKKATTPEDEYEATTWRLIKAALGDEDENSQPEQQADEDEEGGTVRNDAGLSDFGSDDEIDNNAGSNDEEEEDEEGEEEEEKGSDEVEDSNEEEGEGEEGEEDAEGEDANGEEEEEESKSDAETIPQPLTPEE